MKSCASASESILVWVGLPGSAASGEVRLLRGTPLSTSGAFKGGGAGYMGDGACSLDGVCATAAPIVVKRPAIRRASEGAKRCIAVGLSPQPVGFLALAGRRRRCCGRLALKAGLGPAGRIRARLGELEDLVEIGGRGLLIAQRLQGECALEQDV